MFEARPSPWLVPFDGSFRVADAPTRIDDGKGSAKKRLEKEVDELAKQQRVLFAQNRYAVLLVFQAMDAAGKDGTIRAVLSGVNPAGCQVFSFKKPSSKELDHDFLWRTTRVLPERGRIGVFNRSQYEEVLVVRVHPSILDGQQLPGPIDMHRIWDQRLESIADQEKHLARNGTVIMKFWLNVSREEQRKRFLDRLTEEDKNWKFEPGDVRERAHWDDYMDAYEAALNATSRPWAPWYAIPADDKKEMRVAVARIITDNLRSLDLHYPVAGAAESSTFEQMKSMLESE
ncbi:MAG: polyphosphate kinase 2 family protein [Gammaproteobacteria bacterium]|jgi:PPK2 family polyphosphate:nucleotide phosphotransferase